LAKRLTGPFLQHIIQQFNDGLIDRVEAAALLQISPAHLYRLHTRWLKNRVLFRARLSGGGHWPAWPPEASQFLTKFVPLQKPPNFQLVADELASRFGSSGIANPSPPLFAAISLISSANQPHASKPVAAGNAPAWANSGSTTPPSTSGGRPLPNKPCY